MDARGTVDEHVASVVAAKKRLIDGLIDGTETEETTSQSIVEDVLTRIGRSKNVAVVTAQG
jgi:hypothetical protein